MSLRIVIDFLVALFWDKLPNLIFLALFFTPLIIMELDDRFSKDSRIMRGEVVDMNKEDKADD